MRAPLRRAASVALLLAAVAVLPPLQARARALVMVLVAIGLPFVPRPFAPTVTRVEARLDDVRGDLYLPGREAPGILLVHGAALRGKDDPRLIRLAEAVARSGRVVFVPALELAERRFDEDDLERIARAAVALSDRLGAPISMLGISYGGSFALVAAADERLEGRLEQVAVFGAYFDLVGVIQAVTTGESVVGGVRVSWSGAPAAIEILERYATQLAPPEVESDLAAALDGRGDPSDLPPEARAVHELLTNRDPGRTYDLAAALSADARKVFERFSPSSVVDRIRVPVVAMHSRDDPAVPYGEALRLVQGIPTTPLVTVGSFRHVDFEVGSPATWWRATQDLNSAWRFAFSILAPGE